MKTIEDNYFVEDDIFNRKNHLNNDNHMSTIDFQDYSQISLEENDNYVFPYKEFSDIFFLESQDNSQREDSTTLLPQTSLQQQSSQEKSQNGSVPIYTILSFQPRSVQPLDEFKSTEMYPKDCVTTTNVLLPQPINPFSRLLTSPYPYSNPQSTKLPSPKTTLYMANTTAMINLVKSVVTSTLEKQTLVNDDYFQSLKRYRLTKVMKYSGTKYHVPITKDYLVFNNSPHQLSMIDSLPDIPVLPLARKQNKKTSKLATKKPKLGIHEISLWLKHLPISIKHEVRFEGERDYYKLQSALIISFTSQWNMGLVIRPIRFNSTHNLPAFIDRTNFDLMAILYIFPSIYKGNYSRIFI